MGGFVLCLAAVFSACRATGQLKEDAFDDSTPHIAGYPLSVEKMVLFTGRDGLSVTANIEAELAEIADLEWKSDNPAVAAVGESGATVTITPLAAGVATVTATLIPKEGYEIEGELSSVCEVVVLDDFALTPSNMLIFAGDDEASVAADIPDEILDVVNVEWSIGSGPLTLAPSSGKAAALLAPARLTNTVELPVTATLRPKPGLEGAFNASGVEATMQVSAHDALSLTINTIGSIELAENAPYAVTQNISAQYSPAALSGLSPAIVWSSDNSAVASVAASSFPNAVLTAKTAGTANIGAKLVVGTREFNAAPLPVTVTDWVFKGVPVTSVTIASAPSQLAVNDETAQFTVSVAPSNATNKTLGWEYDNTKLQLITVDAGAGKYKLKGLAAGTGLLVKAKAHNNISGQFTLGVTALAVTITKTAGNDVMTNKSAQETASLKAELTPAFASNRNLNWISSDTTALSLSAASAASGAVVTANAKLVSAQKTVTVKAASAQDSSKSASYTFTIKPPVYKVKYDKNGGSGADMPDTSHTYGTASALSANAYTRTHYTFKEWNTKTDGTGTALTQVTTQANTQDAVVTVYAIWTPLNYTIRYEPNGASGSAQSFSVPYGSTQTVKPANLFSAPVDSGFIKWNSAAGGTGSDRSPGDTFTVTGNETLYAIWLHVQVVDAQSSDLMLKFGVKSPGYSSYSAADVSLAFLMTKIYINKAEVNAANENSSSAKLGVIALGDYIDLPNLHVDAYNGAGTVNLADNPAISNGRLLRLIVVGVNSFNANGLNGSTKHLVFQFQGVPVKRGMNQTDSNKDGYGGSEARRYLSPVEGVSGSGKFLAGLVASGVPESVIWAPSRLIGKSGWESQTVDTLSDKLWLPTLWELSKGNKNTDNSTVITNGESAANQAWLSYYPGQPGNENARKKYTTSGVTWWQLASPSAHSSFSKNSFCDIGLNGNVCPDGFASAEGGIVPAFCVK
jgi:hypothetical protein